MCNTCLSLQDAPRTVAVHLEIKHPKYHNSLPQAKAAKTSIELIVLNAMQQRGFTGPINSPQVILLAPADCMSFTSSCILPQKPPKQCALGE